MLENLVPAAEFDGEEGILEAAELLSKKNPGAFSNCTDLEMSSGLEST